MKAKACFRYQILDLRWPVLVYYLVILAITLLTALSLGNFSVVGSAGEMTVREMAEANHTILSGLTGASVVFVFIVGLNSFTENFRFGLQNGVSRKTVFLSRIYTAGVTALFMGLVDQLMHTMLSWIGSATSSRWISVSLFQQIFPKTFENPVQGFFLSVVFGFCLLFLAANLGYAIVMVFYRLKTLGKILVGAGVPAALIFGIPAIKGLDTLYFGERLRAFARVTLQPFLKFAFGSPASCLVSLLVLGVLMALVDWLLLRRAIVR